MVILLEKYIAMQVNKNTSKPHFDRQLDDITRMNIRLDVSITRLTRGGPENEWSGIKIC